LCAGIDPIFFSNVNNTFVLGHELETGELKSGCLNILYSTHWLISFCCDWI